MDESPAIERSIFLKALEIESEEAVASFLEEACGGNLELRKSVEALLGEHNKQDDLLDLTRDPVSLHGFGDSGEIGPYTIREKIGEGGMGVVYVAEQSEPVQRKVAIKVIKPGMDTKEVIARFEAERQALAFMEHPNIARVLDAGATESGRSYFVMELVRGIPITEYCDQVKATPQERLELFQTVCDAVQHAHQKGIIHRDIKPSNVLVTQVSAKPVVKVIDFGLAKATSGQKLTDKTVYTGFMKLMGTPVYMSPEQAGLSGLDIDTRSDVYSLGILLYELLTGTTPLDKTKIQKQAYEELCRQIREVEAPKPSSRISTLKDAERSTIAQQRGVEPTNLRQLLDGDLDVVVLKALEKDRDRRYGTPQDLAADVDRFLNDEPVSAVPPSQLYLARKYFRRHRLAILTAIAFFASLLMGTAFSTWQAVRATKAEGEAIESEQTALDAKRLAVASEQKAVAARDQEKRTAEQRRRELFVADMQLAAQIWNRSDGNQRQIEQLLAKWIPVDDQEDLREFTWRHQWSLLHENSTHAVLENTSSTTFLQNGNLVTAGSDGIRIWNKTGKLVGYPYDDDASTSVLSSNGRWAIVPQDRIVQLIDVSSGNIATRITCDRFSLSSNSRFLACWASNGEVGVWNIETSSPARVRLLRSTTFELLPGRGELLLAPNGESFLLRGAPRSEGYLRNDVLAFLAGRAKPVTTSSPVKIGSWSWSPDGTLFAVGVMLGQIRIQHVAQPEKRIIIGTHGKQISALAFSPDSKTLASGGLDGTIELWDVREYLGIRPVVSDDDNDASVNYEESKTLPIRAIKAHVGAIRSLSFSPDGEHFASTDEFGVTKRWKSVENMAIQIDTAADNLYGGSLGIYPVITDDRVIVEEIWPGYPAAESGQIEKNDRILRIAEGADSILQKVADLSKRELFNLFQGGVPGSTVRIETERVPDGEIRTVELQRQPFTSPEVCRVAFSPDSQSLAIASLHTGATVFAIGNNLSQRYSHSGASVAYSPDGRFLAMDDMFQVALWDVKRQRLRGLLKTKDLKSAPDRTHGPSSMAFSPDGDYLAVGTGWPFFHGSRKSELIVWDLAELKEIENASAEIGVREPLLENAHVFVAVAFAGAGQLIAADHNGVVRIWETSSWSLVETLQFPRITAMAVSPNGNLLALGFGRPRSPDAGIILWDLNAKAYRRKVVGHRPFAIAFSPDGRTLVSTSERHDVVLWDVATGLQLRNLGGHRNTVTGAAFSRDGTKLATTDFSGNLRIRNAAPLAEIDHHPLTLRSLLNLGVVQNQERNYSTAEMTLCHLFARQKELGDREMSATRTEITTALEGQGKLPAIARHPESAKVHLGEQVTLRVEVSGDGPWSFQWFRNGHRIDGATEQELLLTVASNTDFGSYHVAVRPFGRDDVNPVVSNWAHVTERAAPVHPPPRSGEP